MQNEPNFKKAKMNITSAKIKDYENKTNWTLGENEPNSNPICKKTNPFSDILICRWIWDCSLCQLGRQNSQSCNFAGNRPASSISITPFQTACYIVRTHLARYLQRYLSGFFMIVYKLNKDIVLKGEKAR